MFESSREGTRERLIMWWKRGIIAEVMAISSQQVRESQEDTW